MFAEVLGMSKLQAGSTPLTNTPFQHADHQEIIMKVPNGFPGFTFLLVHSKHPSKKEPAQMAMELGFDSQQRDICFLFRHHFGCPFGHISRVKKKKKIFLVTIHASKYKTLTKFLPTYLEVGFSSLNDQKEKLAGGKITPSGTCDKTIKKLTNFPN